MNFFLIAAASVTKRSSTPYTNPSRMSLQSFPFLGLPNDALYNVLDGWSSKLADAKKQKEMISFYPNEYRIVSEVYLGPKNIS